MDEKYSDTSCMSVKNGIRMSQYSKKMLMVALRS